MDRSSPTIFISTYTDSPFLRPSICIYRPFSITLLFSFSLYIYIYTFPKSSWQLFSGYPAIKPQMPKPIIRRTIAFGTGLNEVVGIWPMLFVGKFFGLAQLLWRIYVTIVLLLTNWQWELIVEKLPPFSYICISSAEYNHMVCDKCDKSFCHRSIPHQIEFFEFQNLCFNKNMTDYSIMILFNTENYSLYFRLIHFKVYNEFDFFCHFSRIWKICGTL